MALEIYRNSSTCLFPYNPEIQTTMYIIHVPPIGLLFVFNSKALNPFLRQRGRLSITVNSWSALMSHKVTKLL